MGFSDTRLSMQNGNFHPAMFSECLDGKGKRRKNFFLRLDNKPEIHILKNIQCGLCQDWANAVYSKEFQRLGFPAILLERSGLKLIGQMKGDIQHRFSLQKARFPLFDPDTLSS